MRQLFALAIALLVVVPSMAHNHMLNCSALQTPSMNLYKLPAGCTDPALVKCGGDYQVCLNVGNSACDQGLSCLNKLLRCFENAASTATGCSSFTNGMSNELLYIAAGGEYNGSSLEASCQYALCGYVGNNSNPTCNSTQKNGFCKPPQGPPASQGPTNKPANVPTVTFRIEGNATLFATLLSTPAGYQRAVAICTKIIKALLKDIPNLEIVIERITIGSLIIDFYTLDASLDVAALETKLAAAKANPPAGLFTELAGELGINEADLAIGTISVANPGVTPVPRTLVPTVPGTPEPVPATPTPSSASLVAPAVTLVAALLALVL